MRALRWDEKAAIECGFVNALSWDGGATLRSCGGNLKVDRLVTFGVMDMQRQANQNCPRTLQLSAAIHAFHIGISTDGDYIFRQKQGTVCSICSRIISLFIISLHGQPSSLDTVSWKKKLLLKDSRF